MGLVSVLNYVESLESIEGGTQRSSRRCSFKTGRLTEQLSGLLLVRRRSLCPQIGYSRTQMPCENAGECESPSNVLGWKFAIPGPEHSNILHCRLCGKVFYGGISGLKLHLAHQDRRRFSTDTREEMRMHLTGLSQHNNGDEFDEDFASSTSEMTIQGQDGLELERCSDYGKSEPVEPKHSKSVMKALRKKLSTLVVVLNCRCRKRNKQI